MVGGKLVEGRLVWDMFGTYDERGCTKVCDRSCDDDSVGGGMVLLREVIEQRGSSVVT